MGALAQKVAALWSAKVPSCHAACDAAAVAAAALSSPQRRAAPRSAGRGFGCLGRLCRGSCDI